MARDMYIASKPSPVAARTDWVRNRVPKAERQQFIDQAEAAVPAILRFLDRYNEGASDGYRW